MTFCIFRKFDMNVTGQPMDYITDCHISKNSQEFFIVMEMGDKTYDENHWM